MTGDEFERRPGFPMNIRPAQLQVRVLFAGKTVANSSDALIMEEDGHQPVFYFPKDGVRMDLMTATDQASR